MAHQTRMPTKNLPAPKTLRQTVSPLSPPVFAGGAGQATGTALYGFTEHGRGSVQRRKNI
eukprot:5757799-Amphidinium_carterae.1